jgi:hypothetical protein
VLRDDFFFKKTIYFRVERGIKAGKMPRKNKRYRVAVANFKHGEQKKKRMKNTDFQIENCVLENCGEELIIASEEDIDEELCNDDDSDELKECYDSNLDDEVEEEDDLICTSETQINSLLDEVNKKQWKKHFGSLKGIRKGDGTSRTTVYNNNKKKKELMQSAIGTRPINKGNKNYFN